MLKKLYRNIRILPQRGKEPYVSLYKVLDFYPYNITLYEQALVHKSSSIKMKNGRWINNERLEFLGDAILDAIVADIVFKEFEYKKEGFLTNLRSNIVQRDTLNRIALEIGLDRLLKTSTPKNLVGNTHVYGNALEALIGAIYLDQGYRVAKKFVHEKLIKEHLNISAVADFNQNNKSKLIEWGQKNRIDIEFSIVDSSVDDKNVTSFTTEALVNGICLGVGKGVSKKESHQQAAKYALENIKENNLYPNSISIS